MDKLEPLNDRIVKCMECPRLAKYIRDVAKTKVKRYRDQEYWGKPLTGFGDIDAKLLILGLAPAAHGGNRTGRMFTGDSSGDWLVKALYENGFANQPKSESKDDGLLLKDVYITAVVRCAPPDNKPTKEEIKNCSSYLAEELMILNKVRVVLALGHIAFDTYCSMINMKLKFKHGERYDTEKILIASYHPSRQNTQTGRLTWDSWMNIFSMIKRII